jgi:Ca2+-binding RTX toxin-like protein
MEQPTMAIIIGGSGKAANASDFIFGDDQDNYIFGDRHTAGNPDGVESVGGFLNGRGGHDVIMGGSAIDNVLGDAWVITAHGQGGSDRIDGRRGDDNLFGDAFTICGKAEGGGDQLFGGWGHDNLFGDAFEMSNQAQGGADNLYGGLGADNLFGDAYEMWDRAWGTADHLYGGQGDDRLFGDAFTMAHMARGGRDHLSGGDGQDNLFGDAYEMSGHAWGQNDELEGGAGNDNLFGDGFEAGIANRALDVRGGDDVLIGGTGNDALWGDFASVDGNVIGGKDVFVFGQNSGFDLIADFEHGKDKIDIRGCGIDDFADLTLFDNGSSAVTISFDSHSGVLVQNSSQSLLLLNSSDFIMG